MNKKYKIMIGITICIIGLFILFQLTKTPTIEGITMPYDAKTAKTISDTATAAAATIQSSNNLALTSLNAAKILDIMYFYSFLFKLLL